MPEASPQQVADIDTALVGQGFPEGMATTLLQAIASAGMELADAETDERATPVGTVACDVRQVAGVVGMFVKTVTLPDGVRVCWTEFNGPAGVQRSNLVALPPSP